MDDLLKFLLKQLQLHTFDVLQDVKKLGCRQPLQSSLKNMINLEADWLSWFHDTKQENTSNQQNLPAAASESFLINKMPKH